MTHRNFSISAGVALGIATAMALGDGGQFHSKTKRCLLREGRVGSDCCWHWNLQGVGRRSQFRRATEASSNELTPNYG